MALKKIKVLAIIQARYNSKRFPGKILKKINNRTILEIIIKRLNKCNNISKIVVGCSKNINDKKIISLCKKLKIDCYPGSEENVLKRFFQISKFFNAENILRITADCPLIDPEIVDEVIKNFFFKNVDYASNTSPRTFPDGLDVEVFNFNALKKAYFNAKKKSEKEHVTEYIINNKIFKKYNLLNFKDYSFIRLVLDEPQDLSVIKKIFFYNKNNIFINQTQILNLYKSNKEIFLENSHIVTNEGYNMNIGQKMWKRAQHVIPGGTMLFSKNPDLFLPRIWPAYFSKTKGCRVWDLENNFYDDVSLMGVGTNTLGYNYFNVEKKVIETTKKGTMSTLNSIEEVLLAEKLIEIHPWADMARFTRSGGEANALAIRIARAASGKDKVAICGYHGWHDWYLSANIKNKNNLNQMLMKNVPIKGVPLNLLNTVIPFEYNNFNELKKITEEHDIGVIKMEVQRNYKPENNFLQNVRRLATDKSIVLIFDECTSGFRQTFGGLHKYYKVNPDIAIFGKALGNGYAINSVIGKRSIMEACKETFISSTFWTERIGSVAALETLKNMEKIKSWEIITKIGSKIKSNWKKLSVLHNLQIDILGLAAIPNFSFKSKMNLHYKTFISQEMLKKKIMASNIVFCSIAHNENILNKYFDYLDKIFGMIKKCEDQKEDINRILETPVCLSGIRDNSN